MNLPLYPNQGQKIAPGWDNLAGLTDITAYFGADGTRFLPVSDRTGYNGGVEREMNDGGFLLSGFPTFSWRTPWISDGQIYTIRNTLLGGALSGNVTFTAHLPSVSVGASSVQTFNGKLNLRLNQLAQLQRTHTGYRDFIWQLRVTEVIV